MSEMPESRKRRVYRWGTRWGTLAERRWSVEIRQPTTANDTTNTYLLEECIPQVDTTVIPQEVDDLWEEEYVSLAKDGNLEYNGLVMIRGDARTVLEIAESQGLPVPLNISSAALQPLPQSQPQSQTLQKQCQPHYQHKPKWQSHNRCMIRD